MSTKPDSSICFFAILEVVVQTRRNPQQENHQNPIQWLTNGGGGGGVAGSGDGAYTANLKTGD